MKNLFTTLCFCLLTLLSFGQSSPVKSFMKDLPRSERHHVTKISIGRIPIGIARLFVDKEYRPILKQVKKMRILAVDKTDNLKPETLKNLYSKVDKANFKELIEVREGGERVVVRAKEDEDILRELIIIANDGSELNIIELKGKIKYTELEKLINSQMKSGALSVKN